METLNTYSAGRSYDHLPIEDLAAALELLEAEGITLISQDDDFVLCPGHEFHTTQSSIGDCKVYFNIRNNVLIPRLHCFHSSCRGVVMKCNLRMRQKATAKKPLGRQAPSMRLQAAEYRALGITRHDESFVNEVLAQYPWTYLDIVNDARGKVDDPPDLHHLYILCLFDYDHVVWIGRDVQDSGGQGHIWRFRTVREWLKQPCCPGAFTCPSTFKSGVYSRSAANVAKRKFLVVESDELSRDQIGSVFRWMGANGHALRAVVDTAGKSLHGWFDFPDPKLIPSLKRSLTALKCDPSMFGASQPCRLPGTIRKDTMHYQRLIYFNQDLFP